MLGFLEDFFQRIRDVFAHSRSSCISSLFVPHSTRSVLSNNGFLIQRLLLVGRLIGQLCIGEWLFAGLLRATPANEHGNQRDGQKSQCAGTYPSTYHKPTLLYVMTADEVLVLFRIVHLQIRWNGLRKPTRFRVWWSWRYRVDLTVATVNGTIADSLMNSTVQKDLNHKINKMTWV